MKVIANILYYLLMLLILIIGLLLVNSYFQFTGSYQIKVVKSGSMEPAIKIGSLVVIKPASAYREGDIVTFGRDTKTDIPTTHRIMASRAESGQLLYQVKGDANEEPDQREISQREILGRVILTVPWLGFLLDFARQPLGFILLIVVPALLVIIDELRKIYLEVKRLRAGREGIQKQHATQV